MVLFGHSRQFEDCAIVFQVTMEMLEHPWLMSYSLELHTLKNVAPM